MGITWVQEFLIQFGFVAEQQDAFGISIESADGVNIFRELKIGQRAIGRAIRSELREDAERFVECEEHREKIK